MCGIATFAGPSASRRVLDGMLSSMGHRGPDDRGVAEFAEGQVLLGHNRLSIIDLSPAGHQPMSSGDGRFWVVLNGEIYNYPELRRELESEYEFRTSSDTEVLLAAYQKWGADCLDRLIGMFAFVLWDDWERRLFAARDRFGVKPVYYHVFRDGSLAIASEVKAVHAAGVPRNPDETSWARYLSQGVSDHSTTTFWRDVSALPAGHYLTWHSGHLQVRKWYDLVERSGIDLDSASTDSVLTRYGDLLAESVRLRFRADVPVGIAVSGGLDSSVLVGLIRKIYGDAADLRAFTFVTGDDRYDELPWVEEMLAGTRIRLTKCLLRASDVPALAESVQQSQDEPFGGVPTLAYARLFEQCRADGLKVVLDGQGMDEQWAGYDYYQSVAHSESIPVIQGTLSAAVRPDCVTPEFRARAEPLVMSRRFPDALRNLQLRDASYTKLPRALRFNDRASMRSSIELREPFLDHRLFELALRQPPERKIGGGSSKWLLRELAKSLVPPGVREAPKRPVQTPQREWLRGELKDWAAARIDEALTGLGAGWLEASRVRTAWSQYCREGSSNSFFVWQWINLGLMSRSSKRVAAVVDA